MLREKYLPHMHCKRNMLCDFSKMMKNSPEVLPLDVATITKRFHQLRIEMLAFPSPTGWIHGDAMIHHFFYAIETDKMTLIDFDRFIFAILTDKKWEGRLLMIMPL